MMRQWRSENIEKKIRMRRKVHEVAVEEVIEKCYSVGAERERDHSKSEFQRSM